MVIKMTKLEQNRIGTLISNSSFIHEASPSRSRRRFRGLWVLVCHKCSVGPSIINQFRHSSVPRFLQNSLGTYREKCWITPLLHVLYNWRYMIRMAIVPNLSTPGVSVTWALRCVPVPSIKRCHSFQKFCFTNIRHWFFVHVIKSAVHLKLIPRRTFSLVPTFWISSPWRLPLINTAFTSYLI